MAMQVGRLGDRTHKLLVHGWHLAIGVVLLVACGSDAAGPGATGLEFVAGLGVTDTALHRPDQALVVEVRDERGRVPFGAVVLFETLPISQDDPTRNMYVSEPGGSWFRGLVVDTVDTRGRAAARVQLGTRAGVGAIVVSVPEFGLADTALYSILPGNPFGVNAEPEDTAISLGTTFTLRAAVVDRHGNPHAGAISFQVEGDAVDVDPSGLVVPQTFGQAVIVAQASEYAGFEDTITIGVVPLGTIAAFPLRDPAAAKRSCKATAVVVRQLDGSGRRDLDLSGATGSFPNGPDWSPSGTRIVFHQEIGWTGWKEHLFVVDLENRAEWLIVPGYGIVAETWPQFSQDGDWVYYSGQPDHQNWELWRVRADGSAPERVGLAAGWGDEDVQPSPSPDGTKIVYGTNRAGVHYELGILDLTTGSTELLGLPGSSPRWSPVGGLIGYLSDGVVYVVRPDGTGWRPASPLDRGYWGAIDWSPDGHWIIASTMTGIDVIHVETAEAVPLPGTSDLACASWRP